MALSSQDPHPTPKPTEQVLLNYDELQWADLHKRMEAIAVEVCELSIDEFSKNPDYWRKRQTLFMQHIATKALIKFKANFNSEEMTVMFVTQRSAVIVEMMRRAATDNRLKDKQKEMGA